MLCPKDLQRYGPGNGPCESPLVHPFSMKLHDSTSSSSYQVFSRISVCNRSEEKYHLTEVNDVKRVIYSMSSDWLT